MIYCGRSLTSLTCLTKSLLELDLPEWTYMNNAVQIKWISHCSDEELLHLLIPLHLSDKKTIEWNSSLLQLHINIDLSRNLTYLGLKRLFRW